MRFLHTWRWTRPFLDVERPNLTRCLTYRAPMRYTGGMDSLVVLLNE